MFKSLVFPDSLKLDDVTPLLKRDKIFKRQILPEDIDQLVYFELHQNF